ncbi:MAG: DUF362 domain-containing protein [Myxococcales bacterium]|nr:DUF362 domain-containing protein [Myxococcales bacterium]
MIERDSDAPGDPAAIMTGEIEAHLARIRERARGSHRRELEALFALAREREELATIGYGGPAIRERVATLRADDETRAVVDRALRWAARDERTHEVLARGLLARTRRLRATIVSLAAKLGGLIAGWATAVLHHTTFARAPLSQLIARVIVRVGRLLGKVPDSAATALEHQSFSGFCRFQLGAERTAVISWDHIAARLGERPEHRALAEVAARIADDERKHERMLSALLEAFDGDALRPGHSARGLARALAEIDPAFVGATTRDRLVDEHPIGRGGRVVVREDPKARSGDPTRLRALLRATLDDELLAVMARHPAPKVAIKTTFMMAYDRRDPSPQVDPALLDELALILRERGAVDVAVLEAPNHYDEFFAGRTVAEVARYVGCQSPRYRVVDTAADQVAHAFRRGLGQDSISRTWREADVRVTFGKMRTHPSMLVHLAVNALESLGRPCHEVLFHGRDAELPSALMMIVDALPPDLALLDATHHVPDGLTGILGDPHPCHPGRLYAARDALALDLVAARHMGIARFPGDSALALAIDWFDDPRPRTRIDGPDALIPGLLSPHRNDLTVLLSALAHTVYVAGGDRGNLWVPVMDREAFPPRRRPSLLERTARPTLRTLFGFGRPGPR